jgi:hypothetical protein
MVVIVSLPKEVQMVVGTPRSCLLLGLKQVVATV